MLNLPISPFLDEIARTFAEKGLLLLSAEPGAGKTTLLPWKLLSDPAFRQGKLLLLEPRRLAARAAADRIASLLNEKIGQTVGLRTRLETWVSTATRLEVVTEGVLTRMLQKDQALEGVGTILFDEFHTRSLQGDLGLALAWESRKILRPDLKIAILSATLPEQAIQAAFGPWPLIEVPGRSYPVEVHYLPPLSMHEKPWEAAARLVREALANLAGKNGGVLCFLPGYREMHRARELLANQMPELATRILLLHGQMLPEQQRAVLDPGQADQTRVILATNVAETSLTIPGIKAVVDIGLERRVRFSARTGMDHWDTLPVSQASAEQRKGRAGRVEPGVCYRWWRSTEFREPFSQPEVAEADLAPLLLETALWGAAAASDLTWITPLPLATLQQAAGLLSDLGLLSSAGKITPAGQQAAGLAVHPRLAKMILHAEKENLLETAVAAAALLENEDILPGSHQDFRDRLIAFRDGGPGNPLASKLKRVEDDARRILKNLGHPLANTQRLTILPEAAGVLLLSAYPDRAAKRTRLDDPITSRWLLASGRGALLKGSLSQADYLAIADLDGGETDARVFLAAPISRQDLEQGAAGPVQEVWKLEWQGWKPKSKLALQYRAIVLKETSSSAPPQTALESAARERLQAHGLSILPWNQTSERWLARCRFVGRWGHQADWPAFEEAWLLAHLENWLWPFGNWQGEAIWDHTSLMTALDHYLGWERRHRLDQLAPETLLLPSGSKKHLDYQSQDIPVISARLQEFYGCVTTPKICGEPLLLDLLSPAGRTVQRTRDLDGFWDRAYPEVKKDLMGRYPRHYWPDNPRLAKPTHRAKPRT